MEKNEYALDYVLQAEYNLLRKQFIPGIIVIPSGNSNLVWNGVHFVSQGPYEGGVFRFSIIIPSTFPDGDCPKVLFLSTMYHPQIDASTGELDVMRYFPVWKRNGHHLWQVLRYIRRIFQKIETNNAINTDAAQLYEQDPGAFLTKVSECVNQSKDNLYNPDPSVSEDPHAILFAPWTDKLQTVRQLLLTGKKMVTKSPFPYYALGTIVRGFGRGSKELGCPTANLDEATIEKLPATLDQGVYYGWAQLPTRPNSEVYKMVTSIGTNPFYRNEKKTIETHIMHQFSGDLYGEQLKIVLLGQIRPMATFKNISELTAAIHKDISTASVELDSDRCRQYLSDRFFRK